MAQSFAVFGSVPNRNWFIFLPKPVHDSLPFLAHFIIPLTVGYDIIAKTPLGRIGHMGWFIFPKHQRRGYITEAAIRVLDYAFNEDNCIRVASGCYSENIPTQGVMNKIGFRLEGKRIEAEYHDGKMKDRLDYAINKNEWDSRIIYRKDSK